MPAVRIARRIGRAPALLSLLVGVMMTLALVGTGAGSSEAAPVGAANGLVPGARGELPVAAAGAGEAATTSLEARAEEVDAGTPEVPEVPDADPITEVFATVGSLELHALSEHVQLHGFHQASTPGSRAMAPVGGDHTVLPSRGRGYPATSAVDVVLVDGEAVVSPVTGTVIESESYRLYGHTGDRRLRIRSAEHPHLEVVVLHIGGLQVDVGDEVVAGESTLATWARRLPFTSQVDAETAPHAWPHVHLEVKDRG